MAVSSGAGRVYVAAAVGGVWRSDDQGVTWRSTMDAWDLDPTTLRSASLACGAIAVHPTNADRVYVGTGEAVGSAASYFGVGPIRTDDGGTNWVTELTATGSPSLAGAGFFKLAVDPGDPERVVAATTRGLYRREPAGGGSYSWVQRRTGSHSSVVAARTGSSTTFYAAQRTGGVVVRSTDGGATWAAIGTGFPTANVGRIGLAVRPTDPAVCYALVANTVPMSSNSFFLGVWRFDAGDTTWREVTGAPTDVFGTAATGGQGWYDLDVAVDPNDANRLYLGGSLRLSGGQWCGNIYRCAITSTGSGASLAYSMTSTYIGAGTHADVHALTFAPGSSTQLWAGTDGGLFMTSTATGAATFDQRNVGLATLTMNHLAMHPSEDAVLFCGTQDNGTTRWTGEECWLHSAAGDGGFDVIDWNDPYRVLRTYVRGTIHRATDGGQAYASWAAVSLPATDINNAEFYAPLAGAPQSGTAADAQTVAFGGRRPWISSGFGGGWTSIPVGDATDALPSNILSLAFASVNRLFAGTIGGQVYRFDRSGTTWTRTAIHAAPLLIGPITDIAVDPADATLASVYVTIGGIGDARHVWRFDGTNWQARSGTGATGLLDVQHNAIAVDPTNTNHLYAGADIGVWRSTDGGLTWATFSNGLPDAPVIDLRLHNGRRLLWAATHGRGTYERRLDTTTALGVELYLRDTQLDLGRRPTVNGLADPTRPGETVRHWAGPGTKVDAPSPSLTYQTPTNQINFYQFVDTIVDESYGTMTADPMVTTVINRVYVQVHNRGVQPASSVRVMLLVTNAAAGLPNLPTGYEANVQAGTPITTSTWKTVGFFTLNDLRVGFPQIAPFDLPSTMLAPPADLPAKQHHCLLALLHSPDDQFTSTQVVVDTLSPAERKAAHKNLHVVAFVPGPVAMRWEALWLNGGEQEGVSDLVVRTNGYPGRIRLAVPADVELSGGLEEAVDGFTVEGPDAHAEWARAQAERLRSWLRDERFDLEWTKRQLEALEGLEDRPSLALESGKSARLRGIRIGPDETRTVFVGVEPPADARVGDAFDLVIEQAQAGRKPVGGSTYRVTVVPEPDTEDGIGFKLWGSRGRLSETVWLAFDRRAPVREGVRDRARVTAFAHSQRGVHPEQWPMTYDERRGAYFLRVESLPHLSVGAVRLTIEADVDGRVTRQTETIRI